MATLTEILERRKTKARAFSPSPEESYSLPREYYFSDKVFEEEKEKIWFKNWIFVGLTKDLQSPGDYITHSIVDQKIYVIHSQDGKLRGFYNVCQHRAHTLLEGASGKLGKGPVRCPYHSWAYDSFGNLRSAPYAEEVPGFDYSEFCVPEIRTETLGPMVFVNLDDNARPLSETVGDLHTMFREAAPNFDDLQFVRTRTFDVDCNWKLILDGLECYHCPFIHPEAMGPGNSYLEPSFDLTAGAFHQQHVSTLKEEVATNPQLTPFKIENPEVGALYVWYLWPNLFFASRPGASNWQILETMPVAPEKSRHTLYNFCINNPPTEADLGHMDFYEAVLWPQDRDAVLRQAQGVRTRGYVRGRYMIDKDHSWWSEMGTYLFNKLVWEALNGKRYA